MPAFALAKRLLEEAHVLIFPGTGFGAHWGAYLRFSLAQPAPVLLEALARLQRMIEIIQSVRLHVEAHQTRGHVNDNRCRHP
jgi:aspartate/methionine/tyrosine aminotransferase